jgi:hypothetical protein
MAGINGSAGFAALLLATVMATSAGAAVPGEICSKSAAAPVEATSPVVPAAEVAVPENKNTKDCPASTERRAEDDVCVFNPEMEKDQAPAKRDTSAQVSRDDKEEGFVGQLLRTAGHVWSAVVTTLNVVTRDARV